MMLEEYTHLQVIIRFNLHLSVAVFTIMSMLVIYMVLTLFDFRGAFLLT